MPSASALALDAQSKLLRDVQALHLCTDASLAAYCHDLGSAVDRSAITHWREGRTPAPLGLLFALLGHVEPAKVLGLIARRYGLRVVPDVAGVAGDRFVAIAAFVGEAGRALGEVAPTLRDGVVSADEAAAVDVALEHLAQQIADARASLGVRR